MVFNPGKKPLFKLYDSMRAAYGPLDWWPAETPFEVAVGAILTQNTAWTNVEKALGNLKAAGVLNLQALLALSPDELGELIRPAGYFNIKAKRLHNLCVFLASHNGLEGLAAHDTACVRKALLDVNGVGPETADDILLYGLDRAVFVVDTYTRRVLQRHQLAQGNEAYDEIRLGFEAALPADVALFREYHALIVEHAKRACTKMPKCAACAMQGFCPSAAA